MVSISNFVMEHMIPPRPLWSLLDVLEKTIPASDDENLEEGDGTDEESSSDEDSGSDEGDGSDDDSSSDEDITGRKAFIKLKKWVEMWHPRPAEGPPVIAAAADPAIPDSEEEQPSERMLSENTATVLDSKDDTTAGTGNGEVQQEGNDNVAVSGSQSQAARSTERISVPTRLPEEDAPESHASSHYQRELTLQNVDLGVPTDRRDAIPSPGHDLDFTTERDSGDVSGSSTELRVGRSDSLEVAASDNPRLTAPTLQLNLSASDGSPPGTWTLSHGNTAHTDTPLAFSDDVRSPDDPEHLSSPTLHPPGSTPDLGQIITHSPGTNSDEDVQLAEQSWNPVVHSDQASESIEMAKLGVERLEHNTVYRSSRI
ncbi:hypothetical protein EW026_g4366 [Hermanssonia centrifuga]|uniref:Uncharacterized protein n=1 Tax=Hermanssonia centrifuga TaxID=98765 RepID=A0A4S4KIG1_9APHY|nr:hypothetical protein EW026_g4366 [Hermanssonia centrifuga]